jgi:hypothetical protein
MIYELIQQHLFSEPETMQNIFTVDERNVIMRYRAAYIKWFSEPYLTDIQILNFLKNEFKIKNRQAYYDLSIIKNLLSDVTNGTKDFQRYRVNEMILEGFQLAERAKNAIEINKALAFVKAAEALTKVHKLNINELKPRQWEDIVPIELEPPTEISVVGSIPLANLEQLKEKLRKKYYISE